MNIAITGPIGSGKSTIVRRVMEQLGWRQPAGFLTRRSADQRSAPALVLETWEGTSCVFAQLRKSLLKEEEPPYAVDLSALNRFAVEHMANAPAGTPVVMDELGGLELGAETFTQAVASLFQRPVPILAVIQKRALDRWLKIIRQKNIEHVFQVENGNRDRLPAEIAALLKKWSRGDPAPA